MQGYCFVKYEIFVCQYGVMHEYHNTVLLLSSLLPFYCFSLSFLFPFYFLSISLQLHIGCGGP